MRERGRGGGGEGVESGGRESSSSWILTPRQPRRQDRETETERDRKTDNRLVCVTG